MQYAELEKQDYSRIDANKNEQSRTYHDQRNTLFFRILFQCNFCHGENSNFCSLEKTNVDLPWLRKSAE